ncbi:MAG: phosphate acyltransferase PlsX [Alphaproteobacteria bacterium]|nr:phosphate acyltransferase PlsX [Alphaproteobacteria bacterium]
MPQPIIIALDAMGGDKAPDAVIDGAAAALQVNPNIKFRIYGDEARVRPLIARHASLANAIFHHTPDSIPGDMKPSAALRQGRNSSMRLAINAVADGHAQGVVSAGNTGALMALARLVLGSLPGIDRPAIVSTVPTMTGRSVMLDMGANLECDADNLVQFAIMGSLYARAALHIQQPRIGLLNIGSEEMKGHDELRAAAAILRETPLHGKFIGYIEADQIPHGDVDVVVTDGFTGNITLKTIEGTAKLCANFLKEAMQSSLLAKVGALLARGAFMQMKARMDPRAYNGAMLVGLQGVCVKSHGGTDARGFTNSVLVAAQLIEEGLNDRIKDEFAKLYGTLPNAAVNVNVIESEVLP